MKALQEDARTMLDIRRLFRSKATNVVSALDRSLAIIEFDPFGKILSANAQFCGLMGYHASEIVGQHHRIFVKPEYAASEAYRDFWRKLGRGEYDQQEYLRIAKGGKQVWIQASYNPLRNANGKVASIVKVASDITDTRLRNATFEAKLEAISRVQGVIEFTPTGEVIDANDNFLAVLGYRLDDIKGKHHRMFVDSAQAKSAEYQEFWRKLNAGEFVAGEFKRIGRGGKEVWIQASYNPIFNLDHEVTSIVKFATDITGRVRAVAEVAGGLTELADNNLEHRLDKPFDAAYEPIRADYNLSLDGLQTTISQIAASAETINAGTQSIASSTGGMSRRIEQQAAGLERTAAALDQITATVRRSAAGALEAALAATGARSGTVLSGKVMNQAASVMSDINESSNKITQIIGVMDEIAFQTNLLALNAGVEAARAGDAGRGFAVVAQEVRALAQRSASAAKEIKSLIAASSDEVKRGVTLVNETAVALEGVTAKVGQIDGLLSEMALSAQEQATGLGQVNIAVNQMDQVTQENAAMIEEATAAANSLQMEAADMTALMGRFRIGNGAHAPAKQPARLRVVAASQNPQGRERAHAS
jgi:methyl-accepting chemotaxis protein